MIDLLTVIFSFVLTAIILGVTAMLEERMGLAKSLLLLFIIGVIVVAISSSTGVVNFFVGVIVLILVGLPVISLFIVVLFIIAAIAYGIAKFILDIILKVLDKLGLM